ncbi:MAG: hypothetical protein V7K77_12535 [Nostoc sp.]
MPNNNGSGVETLSPLLVILVAGSRRFAPNSKFKMTLTDSLTLR